MEKKIIIIYNKVMYKLIKGDKMNINKENIEKTSPLRNILIWFIDIIIVFVGVYIIITFVGQRTSVVGESMESTLHNGDQIVIDKFSYRFREPKRFDIVVFPYRMNPEMYYIKRIIGLPGEKVQIKNKKIYINGAELKENFGKEPILKYGVADQPIIVQKDEYFVMGDNRNNSSDSREMDVGNIERKDIVGRAWLRIWPLNKFGFLKHK